MKYTIIKKTEMPKKRWTGKKGKLNCLIDTALMLADDETLQMECETGDAARLRQKNMGVAIKNRKLKKVLEVTARGAKVFLHKKCEGENQ